MSTLRFSSSFLLVFRKVNFSLKSWDQQLDTRSIFEHKLKRTEQGKSVAWVREIEDGTASYDDEGKVDGVCKGYCILPYILMVGSVPLFFCYARGCIEVAHTTKLSVRSGTIHLWYKSGRDVLRVRHV